MRHAMSESNPYAPPAATDPAPPAAAGWQVHGPGLLVSGGTVLPQVDLETGEREEGMKSIPRDFPANGLARLVGILIVGGAVAAPGMIGAEIWYALIGASLLFAIGRALRGNVTNRAPIREFISRDRERKMRVRQRWRAVTVVAGFVLIMVTPLTLSPSHPDYMTIIIAKFGGGGLLLVLAAYLLRDRTTAKTLPGPPGWLKISPVHPDALAYLAGLENERRLAAGNPRKRLVRTIYFHRYPLRLILGKRWNPFLVINLALMKWLRSRRLERDIYHSSESEPMPLDTMCPAIRGQIHAWLAAHPDWTIHKGESVTWPDGSLTTHAAVLVSPGLEHSVNFTCLWTEARPDRAEVIASFNTWLANGLLVRTWGTDFLELPVPRVNQFRAKGNPEQLFAQHLRNLGGHAIDASRDTAELDARILLFLHDLDDALTAAGYQSELREI